MKSHMKIVVPSSLIPGGGRDKIAPLFIFFKLHKNRKSYEFETLTLFKKIIWPHFLEFFSFETIETKNARR